MTLRQTPVIESPCKLICQLDLATSHCFGCGRSRQEIALWTRYSDTERREIMEALPARLQTL
jgi:predicted Fe-S protein YdhL (DUF1289 family)